MMAFTAYPWIKVQSNASPIISILIELILNYRKNHHKIFLNKQINHVVASTCQDD